VHWQRKSLQYCHGISTVRRQIGRKALEAFVSVAQAAGVKDSAVSRNSSSTHLMTNVLNREMRDGETVMLVLVDI
jgi:hypothetical protein